MTQALQQIDLKINSDNKFGGYAVIRNPFGESLHFKTVKTKIIVSQSLLHHLY